MAARFREKNWSSTSLGGRDAWPLELTTTLGVILDSAFAHCLFWGSDYLSFFNDAYSTVTARDGDWLGRPGSEVWPEIWDELLPTLDAARAGQASFHENRLLVVDRGHGLQESWWTFSLSPVRDGGNRIAGVLCTAWETSKLVRAERCAEQRAAELDRFSALVPELLWVTRKPHEITWANQRMIDYLGTDPALGTDWPSIVHPDDLQAVGLRYEKAISRRETFESRHRLRRADGEYRWVLARSEPAIDADGKIEAWYGAATDMHDWHLATEAIRGKERLFETFTRSSRKVLWMADLASRRINYMGGDTAHLFGEKTASRCRTWDDWEATVHPDDRDRQADFLPRLQAGELICEEYRVIGDNGRVRTVRETLFPIPDVDGEIRSIGGIAERLDTDDVQQIYLIGFAQAQDARLAGCFWRQGLSVQSFSTLDQFVKLGAALQPGCILYAAGDSSNALGRILGALNGRRPCFRVIALSPYHDKGGEVRSLMKMGAFDVLPEGGGGEERLLRIVHEALQSLTGDESDAGLAAQGARERLQALSPREREVLGRLMAGLSSKLIAKELGLSPRTVEVHRANIKEKLQVGSLPEALALAAAAGIS